VKLAPPTREPRQAEAAYIRDLTRVWGVAQALIAMGVEPLLAVWPDATMDSSGAPNGERRIPPDASATGCAAPSGAVAAVGVIEYNPLRPQPRRRSIEAMSDAELARLWPTVSPADIRRHAPWATSRDEVVRVAYPGAPNASNEAVEAYVREAVQVSQSSQYYRPGDEAASPTPRFRGRYQAPVVTTTGGSVVPPPPRPSVVNSTTIGQTREWMEDSLSEAIHTRNLEPVVLENGFRTARWNGREVKRVAGINPADDPTVALQLRQWRRINVNLIESGVKAQVRGWQRRSLLNDVVKALEEGFEQGLRVGQVAARIAERFEVSESRAQLIARDQTLKLNGQLNRSRQRAAGVEQYVWVTARDERVRPEHEALDGTVQRWDTPTSEGFPGDAVQCFDGSQVVTLVPGVDKLWRARFCGEATELVTESGETLLVTPNHPLLTDKGWMVAGDVQVSDELVTAGVKGLDGLGVHQDDHVTFQQVFDFFAEVIPVESVKAPGAKFYGDVAPDADVDVVDVDWGLMLERYTSLAKPLADVELARADHPALSAGSLDFRLMALGRATDSIVRLSRELLALVWRHHAVPQQHSLTSGSRRDSVLAKDACHRGPTDSNLGGDSLDAHRPPVQLKYGFSKVVSAIPRPLDGHVYTLQSLTGWYHTACVSANCRCTARAVVTDFD